MLLTSRRWSIAFVAVAATVVWLHLWKPLAQFRVVGISATLIGGFPIFKEAFESILARRMTMELSMTIALVAALSIGQTFTALVITFFVLVTEILEHLLFHADVRRSASCCAFCRKPRSCGRTVRSA